MKALTFEYSGYHFAPYMKLTGRAADFNTKAMAADYKNPLMTDDNFSHADFYAASPIKDCDLFKCMENKKIYIPSYNLHEYTGELHGIDPIFASKRNKDYER